MRAGQDLRTMGLRRIRVLVDGLPPGSATARSVNPDDGWSTTDHLLAGLIEVVDQTSWRAVLPHAKKGWKPPAPLKVPRPGDPVKAQAQRGMSMDAFRKLLGKNVQVVAKGGE